MKKNLLLAASMLMCAGSFSLSAQSIETMVAKPTAQMKIDAKAVRMGEIQTATQKMELAPMSKIAAMKAASPASSMLRAAAVLPYSEDFEEFPYENSVPRFAAGWSADETASGDFMQCGYISADAAGTPLPAASGNYYLISGYDASAARDEWAFAPSIALQAGKKYRVSFYVIAQGYGDYMDEFKLTVGADATKAAQTTVVVDKSGNKAMQAMEWTEVSAIYSPATSGDFVFAFNHCTQAKDVNAVMFDLFQVVEIEEAAPVADFETANTEIPFGTIIEFTDKSTNFPTSWSWNLYENADEPYETENPYAYAYYGAAGSYDISMTATNQYGSNTKTKADYITVSDKGFHDFPCVEDMLDPCCYLGWSGTDDWMPTANGFYMSQEAATQNQSFAISRPYYFEAGEEYRIGAQFALDGTGAETLSMYLAVITEEGISLASDALITYTDPENPTYFEAQSTRVSINQSGNYYVLMMATGATANESLYAFRELSITYPAVTSEYAQSKVPEITSATVTDKIVNLMYGVPGAATTISYSNGEYAGAIGTGGAGVFGAGAIYEGAMTAPYVGQAISAIRVYIADVTLYEGDFIVAIMNEDPADDTMMQTLSQTMITATDLVEGWNVIQLDDAVTIEADQYYLCAAIFNAVEGSYPIPYDSSSSSVAGSSDLIFIGTAGWSTLSGNGFAGNSMVAAIIGDETTDYTAPVPDAYGIFRNEELLAVTSSRAYADNVVTDGTYNYQVVAVYDGDAISSISEVTSVTVGEATGVENSAIDAISVVGMEDAVAIKGLAEETTVAIATIDGRAVKTVTLAADAEINLATGFYAVTVGDKTYKVFVK